MRVSRVVTGKSEDMQSREALELALKWGAEGRIMEPTKVNLTHLLTLPLYLVPVIMP